MSELSPKAEARDMERVATRERMEFSPEAETEGIGLCDDEGAGAKAAN